MLCLDDTCCMKPTGEFVFFMRFYTVKRKIPKCPAAPKGLNNPAPVSPQLHPCTLNHHIPHYDYYSPPTFIVQGLIPVIMLWVVLNN